MIQAASDGKNHAHGKLLSVYGRQEVAVREIS